jgi:hypothetical protein
MSRPAYLVPLDAVIINRLESLTALGWRMRDAHGNFLSVT